MPTIAQAVKRNEALRARYGVTTLTVPVTTPIVTAPLSSRTVLPTRGTYPPSIILATDFESATGYYYGRLRARTLLTGVSK